ncbi:MAG: PLP-dependent aminotransferase family protein [Chloroflexi bacterium]|nr:PLP-dependent aminotransferase family protein [Chloroflexota bacterium]
MQTSWNHRYAQRTQRMAGSAIRELLKFTELPDVISFAGGLPAPELFPVAEIASATASVLSRMGSQALQYGATEGYTPLRELLAQQSGAPFVTANILITTGSQQALDLLGKIFINPGDRILVESPTYVGALQAMNAYGAEYVAIPSDDYGMITENLEEALHVGPKLIYVLPNFQNPSGVTLSLERRRQLLDLSRRYGVPIIEDDPYGQLRFEGDPLPSLLSLAAQDYPDDYQGNVIYLSTFSKTLAPGLRVAWVVAPAEVARKLVLAKQGADLHTASLNQILVHEIARTDFLDRHVPLIRQVYRERRDLMVTELAAHLPPGVRWTYPQGGLFLWVTLPEGLDAAATLQAAIAQKVAFVPGAAFFPCGGGANTLRLNFSNANPVQISQGIARLGRVIYEQIDELAHV